MDRSERDERNYHSHVMYEYTLEDIGNYLSIQYSTISNSKEVGEKYKKQDLIQENFSIIAVTFFSLCNTYFFNF